MGRAVGIDLGTSKSLVAAVIDDRPVVLPARDGRSTPSVVAFPRRDEVLVGEAARKAASRYPDRTFWSFKDLLGAVERRVVVENHHLLPEDLATHVIVRLKEDAEAYLGEAITQAVLTVPAGASYRQRQATRTAARGAGLEVLRIVREPTAAAVAYHFLRSTEEGLLVFDLGGGTLDVAVVDVGEGVIAVASTASDLRLGGDDFDLCVVRFLADRFQRKHDIDLMADAAALQRLKSAAEVAKIDLSSTNAVDITLPFIAFDRSVPLSLTDTLDRATFESLTADLRERCCQTITAARKEAELAAQERKGVAPRVDRILFVGGGSRTPGLVRSLQDFVGLPVATGINPDHAVALGAALQAGVLTGVVKDTLLLDALKDPLGIETQGGAFSVLIPYHTTFPTRRTEIFSTQSPRQDVAEIRVLEGRAGVAADAEILGRLRLTGLSRRKGTPEIEVTLDVDANEILHVAARERVARCEAALTITTDVALEARRQRRRGELEPHDPLVPRRLGASKAPPKPASGRKEGRNRAGRKTFFFISYASVDRHYVDRLADHLQARSVPVWYDREVEPGSTWASDIEDRLKSCRGVLVVLTLRSIRSRWVENEVLLALDLNKPIFPLRLDDVRYFPLLNIHHEDVLGGALPSERLLSRLVEVATG
ncbi:MAG TPA: Hsp70 family protein [Acidimicrobiales bacterium]